MEPVINACKLMLQGKKVSTEQENAIKLFMQLPENVQTIMKACLQEVAVLTAFKIHTQSLRRTGQYFDIHNNGSRMIIFMLNCLFGPPPFLTQQQCNMFLALQGELLGSLIIFGNDEEFVTNFLHGIWTLPVMLEMKVHIILKIVNTCCQQVFQNRQKYAPEIQKRYKILRFFNSYGETFIRYISVAAQTISLKHSEFNLIWNAMDNLLHCQQSYLKAMGQSDPTQSPFQQQNYKTKTHIPDWQHPHLTIWGKYLCSYVQKILQFVAESQQYKQRDSLKGVSGILCRCVNLLNHIYSLIFFKKCNSKNQGDLQQNLGDSFGKMVIENCLNPIFRRCQYYQKMVGNIMNLSQQCQTAILKMLTTNQELFEELLKTCPLTQNMHANDSKIINQIKHFCEMAVKTNYFYFTDFDECPIGQSLKLMSSIKKIGCKIFLPVEQQSYQIKNYPLKQSLNTMYDLFFQDFMMTKLLDQQDFGIQNEQLYSQGRDWQQFISNSLNCYFDQLAIIAPRYFSNTQISSDNMVLQDFDLYLQIRSETQFETVNKKNLMLQSYMNNKGFLIFWRMLSCITAIKCQNQDNTIVRIQQNSQMKQIMNQQSEFNLEQQQIQFSNLMPMLSCFRALINSAMDCQVKSFFFHQFFMIQREINLQNYVVCAHKAKICKLYIVDVFMEEIVPDSFVQYGEMASGVLGFIVKHFNQSFNFLVIQCADIISECLEKLDPLIQDSVSVVEYGLSILQRLSMKISQRVCFLQDERLYENKKIGQDYSLQLQFIFDMIKQLDINLPSAYKKRFIIAGYFIDLCGHDQLYQIYLSLQRETLQPTQYEQSFEPDLSLYLAGVTGLLSGIRKSGLFRQAAELTLMDISSLKASNKFVITDGLLETYLNFLQSLMTNKIYQFERQDAIGLEIHRLFASDFPNLAQKTQNTQQMQKLCMRLYQKMVRLNDALPLPVLPRNIKLNKYHSVLNEYFNAITRLQDISILQQYSTLKMQWLISFLQAKIQRFEFYPLQSLNLQTTLLNLRFQKCARVHTLKTLISMATDTNISIIAERFNQEFKNADSVFYYAPVVQKEVSKDDWV